MAQGIRIRHHTAAGGLFIVPLLHKPFPAHPPREECGACARAGQSLIHPCKTIHLMLDDSGAVIVSEAVWEDIQKVQNRAGFTPANVVIKPPAQSFTPATAKLKVEAIEFGTAPASRPQYSTGSGTMTKLDPAAPDIMDMDQYLAKAGALGISGEDASNMLLIARMTELNGKAK